jgi:hypothetical protein
VSGNRRHVVTELSGDYAEYIIEDADTRGVNESDIVRRAVALYSVLVEHIEAGEQVLVRYLADAIDLPQLIRVDYYTPPAEGTELALHPDLDDQRHFSAEVMAWPPIDE